MRGIFFEEDHARAAALVLVQAGFSAEVVRERGIAIAVLATPTEVAQDVADLLVAAGVTSILNFAPAVLQVPDHVQVRKVDLSVELQILAYHEQRKSESDGDLAAWTSGRPAPAQEVLR